MPGLILLLGLAVGLGGFGCIGRASPLPDDLAQAERAEREQDPSSALAFYQSIVEACLRNPRLEAKDPCGTAAFRRAQILERLQRPSEAASAFVMVRTLSSDGQTIARALFRAAALYAGPLQKPEAALHLCRQIISRWPDEVAAEDALRLLVEMQENVSAAALADELGQLAATLHAHEIVGSFALYYQARLYEKQGQSADALVAYDSIWQRFPRGPLFDDALFAASKLLRAEQNSAEAAKRLERLQDSFRKAIIVGHYNKLLLDDGAILLGQIYLNDLDQPEQAIATLERFVKRQKSSLLGDDALLLMAEAALRRHGESRSAAVHEACAYLGRLRRDYPDGNSVRRAAAMQLQLGCLAN